MKTAQHFTPEGKAIAANIDFDLARERKQESYDAHVKALFVAEEMLTTIMKGGSYSTKEYMDNLLMVRAALAKHKPD